MNLALKWKVIRSTLFSFLICGFVWKYSHLRLEAFKYAERGNIVIGLCELLIGYSSYMILVPISALIAMMACHERKCWLLIIAYSQWGFAIGYFLLTILAWEAQQIPWVGVNGFK